MLYIIKQGDKVLSCHESMLYFRRLRPTSQNVVRLLHILLRFRSLKPTKVNVRKTPPKAVILTLALYP